MTDKNSIPPLMPDGRLFSMSDVVADITKLGKAVIELTVAVAKIKQSTDVDIRVLNDAVADLNDKMEWRWGKSL
jgi:hypothetical protein